MRMHGYQMLLTVLTAVMALGLACAGQDDVAATLASTLRPGLTLTIDKGCGGTYAPGELISVTAESSRAGYLTLLDFTPDGRVIVIFPNSYARDNRIDAGVEYRIPGAIAPFDFVVEPPSGWEIFYGVVTEAQTDLVPGGVYDFGQVFPAIQGRAHETARAIGERVGIISTGSWCATALCSFRVGDLPPAADESGWALFLGVDDYDETLFTGEDGGQYRFPKLSYAAKGANDMARALADAFPHQKIMVNREVTHDGVRAAIADWLGLAPADSPVLIYYSGHGSRQKDADGDENDQFDETIVPWDYGLHNEYIVDDELAQWVSELRSLNVLLVFDSCYSGSMERGALGVYPEGGTTRSPQPVLTDGIEGDLAAAAGTRSGAAMKRIVITACRPDEVAYESHTLQNGVLTYYLLEGLAGSGDADGDSWVTAQEAYQYSAREIETEFGRQHPQMVDQIGTGMRLREVE